MNKRMRNQRIRALEKELEAMTRKKQVLQRECELLLERKSGGLTPEAAAVVGRGRLWEENQALRRGAEQIHRLLDAYLAVLCRRYGQDSGGGKTLTVDAAELAGALEGCRVTAERTQDGGGYRITVLPR